MSGCRYLAGVFQKYALRMAELETAYSILAQVFKSAKMHSKSLAFALSGAKSAGMRMYASDVQPRQKVDGKRGPKTALKSDADGGAHKGFEYEPSNTDQDAAITYDELADVCTILSGTRPDDEYLEQMFDEAAAFQELGGALKKPESGDLDVHAGLVRRKVEDSRSQSRSPERLPSGGHKGAEVALHGSFSQAPADRLGTCHGDSIRNMLLRTSDVHIVFQLQYLSVAAVIMSVTRCLVLAGTGAAP